MATGDTADILSRLKSLLPRGWFEGPTPILDAVLTGPATGLSFGYSLLIFAKAQGRLATAKGGFLDLAAYDFFGYGELRRAAESDANYAARISRDLTRLRNTRPALITVLNDLTGRNPVIHEPWNPLDTGGYDVAGAYDASNFRYGALSKDEPAQTWVDVYRPTDGRTYTDAMAYAAIESVRTAGTIIWVQFHD